MTENVGNHGILRVYPSFYVLVDKYCAEEVRGR